MIDQVYPEPPVSAAERFLYLAGRIANSRARSLSGRFGFLKADVPDIEQELLLEIYRQQENFDPGKGSDAAFILQVVNNKIVKMIDYRQAECRDWRKCRQSLNETITLPDTGTVELLDLVCVEDNENFALTVDVDIIRDRLPAELQELCDCLSKSMPGDAMEEVFSSRSTFRRRLKKLRENFQKYGFSGNFL